MGVSLFHLTQARDVMRPNQAPSGGRARPGRRGPWAVAALLAAAGLWAAAAAERDRPAGPPEPPAAEDPFPIRRLQLPPDRLAAALEKGRDGVLTRVGRDEFEGLVGRAARAGGNAPPGPRLAEARYRARLQDGADEPALVGTAEWKVNHPGKGPGLLALEPMQLALRQARWTDGRSAAIGLLDPRSPGALALLVEHPGAQSLALEWSARGLPGPGEVGFSLQLPPAPVAGLEVDLPAGLTPVAAQADALLTGPFPADDRHQSWRIACGGMTRLDLSLRKPAEADRPPPLPRTRLASRQDLSPGVARCRFDLELEALRGPLTTLTLEHDPALTVTDVSANNLESWKPEPAPGRGRLLLRFREPVPGGRVEVTGTAPVPVGESRPWVSPGLTAAGGVSRGESLELRLSADLQPADWQPGSFQLLRSDIAADGSQSFTLQATPAEAGGPVRPRLTPRATGSEFQVRQQSEWAVRPDRSTLTSVLDVDVTRAALTHLPLRLPPDGAWGVESVEAVPRDLTPQAASGPAGTLLLEFPRPLAAGTPCAVTVRLRRPGTHLAPEAREVVPLPDLAPVGARHREGTLTVRVSPAFQASAPAQPPDPDFVGPPAPPPEGPGAVWVYHFQGHPPVGSLHLRARPARLATHAESDVSLAGGRPTVRARLRLSPETGVPPAVAVWSPHPVAGPWEWRTVEGGNPVVGTRPVPVGAALPLLGLAGDHSPAGAWTRLALAAAPSGSWWQITFARPLDGPVVLESVYEPAPPALSPAAWLARAVALLDAPPALGAVLAWAAAAERAFGPADPVPVPLPAVVGADRVDGSVSLYLPPGARRGWRGVGLLPDRPDPAAPGRLRFRYGDGPVSLVLLPVSARPPGPGAVAAGARLVTAVDGTGARRCHFRFRVANWASGVLPVRLPEGAELQGVAVAGRTPPAGSVRTAGEPGAVVCSLPVPAGPDWQEVELLYTLPGDPWRFTNREESPEPVLPVTAGPVERRWMLAPGVVPLGDRGLTLLPGAAPPEAAGGLASWLPRAPDPDERPAGPRPGAVRAGSARPQTFAQALAAPSPGFDRLLIDRDGLAEAGVSASTPVPPGADGPFWEALPLEAVPFRGAAVLTTPRQKSVWRAEAGEEAFPEPVRAALAEAAGRGRDASGRFQSAAQWLADPPASAGALSAYLYADGPGWTGWHDVEGRAALRLVRSGAVGLAGVWLGLAVLAGAAIRGGGSPRRDWLLLAALLAAAVAAAEWLPPALRDLGRGPLAAGLLAGLWLACRARPPAVDDATVVTRPRRPPAGSSRRVVIACLLAGAAAAVGADPEPATVYLVPADGRPGAAVLAPPELLERLRALARPAAVLPDAAVLRARFEGVAREGGAEFEAHFDLWRFADGPAELTLPLGGVLLRDAVLDGAAAYPQAAGPDRYRFELPGKGEHRLVLKFTAPVTGTGVDREVRFTAPELAQARLRFTAPAGSVRPHAVNWRGGQQPVGSPGDPGVEADLGRTRTVHVRWRQPGQAPEPLVLVQEAGLWDLDGPAATLLSEFDYRVTQGTVTGLRVAVPAGLEVARVDVRPELEPANAPPAWVRDWRLGPEAGGFRPIAVGLQAPLTGRVRLTLELVPAHPLTARPKLAFPTALDVAESEAYAALRARRLELGPGFERHGVTEFSPESFLRDVWKPMGGTGGVPARAFRRARGAAALLQPVLAPPGANARARQELVWRVGPRRMEVRGRARWQAPGDGLALVECEVPASVAVTDVHGPGLNGWCRAGDRVRAWLFRPQAEVVLNWSGVVNRPARPDADTVPVDVPPVRLGNAETQQTTLRLHPVEGWALTPERVDGLKALAPQADRELAYQAEAPGPAPHFVLRGPQADAAFRVLTVAEVRRRELVTTARVEAGLRHDRPHSLGLRLRDAARLGVEVAAPAGCRVTPAAAPAGARAWSVEVPPRDQDRLTLTVTVTRPLPSSADLYLPAAEVLQGELPPARLEQFVALAGSELLAREASGLRRVPDAGERAALHAWPEEAARLRQAGGAVWRVADADWRLRLTASPVRLAAAAPVQAALADYEATPTADGWAYRVAYELAHEPGAALTAHPPTGARWAGLVVDGVTAPVHDPEGPVAIPLPPDGGARAVSLGWRSSGVSWEPPRLTAGEVAVPADVGLWTAYLPAGWRLAPAAPLGPAAADLVRAEALAAAARQRLDREPGARGGAAGVFAARAARWLTLAEVGSGGAGVPALRAPDGRPLSGWLADLAAPDRATAGAGEGWNRLPDADLFARGTPVRWPAAGSPEAPRPRPPADPALVRSLAATGLAALALAALAGLGLLPARAARPERLAALGLIGLLALGGPEALPFLAVLIVGLLARVVAAGRRVARWLAA